MQNEKGMSLAITAIVVIAVGLVVLVVVLGYFVGGFGRTGSAMRDVTSTAEDVAGSEVEEGLESVGDVWKKGAGEPCDGDYDCKSGNCTNGVCD